MNFGAKAPVSMPTENESTISVGEMTFGHNSDYYLEPILTERSSGRGYKNWGEYNLHPEYLKYLYNSSSLHARLINWKKSITVGNGYTIDTSQLKGMELIEYNQLISFFDGSNSLDKILDKMALSYYMVDAIWIRVTWNDDNTKIIKREVLDWDTIRIGDEDRFGNINYYYYCFDWKQTGKYPIIKYPKIDVFNKTEKTQIYAFQLDAPTQKFYPKPTYETAKKWISLDGAIADLQLNGIRNSAFPGMVFTFYKKPGSPEQERDFLNKFERNFQNTKNTGRPLILFSDGKDNAPEVKTVDVSDIDKLYNQTASDIQRNIIIAHGVSGILLGFETTGSLGNATEFPFAYDAAMNTIIKPAQKDIESIIQHFFRINGINVTFKLNLPELTSLNK